MSKECFVYHEGKKKALLKQSIVISFSSRMFKGDFKIKLKSSSLDTIINLDKVNSFIKSFKAYLKTLPADEKEFLMTSASNYNYGYLPSKIYKDLMLSCVPAEELGFREPQDLTEIIENSIINDLSEQHFYKDFKIFLLEDQLAQLQSDLTPPSQYLELPDL